MTIEAATAASTAVTAAASAREALDAKRLVIVGAGSRVGRRLAQTASAAGAELVLAGPDTARLQATAATLSGPALIQHTDLADEDSIAELAARAGSFDHLVSTAAMPANGPVAQLEIAAVQRAFAAKVFGPLLLAKHLAAQAGEGGSFTFFSGVAAWRPMPERVVTATTNGALAFLVEALAVELAPLRVNAVSPGIVDSGAWDGLGEGKQDFLRQVGERNPARRTGTPDDLIRAVLYALASPFVTGTVLHVDGGGRLA
ncbi:SDR family oxidoreductase [Streptomyces sp. NPDC021096]|uniref:SDR family oxidoreductase n=1 Tax=Streptomyces sp. NPDC021096 TaxID=3154792 RepID=UPI0034023885